MQNKKVEVIIVPCVMDKLQSPSFSPPFTPPSAWDEYRNHLVGRSAITRTSPLVWHEEPYFLSHSFFKNSEYVDVVN